MIDVSVAPLTGEAPLEAWRGCRCRRRPRSSLSRDKGGVTVLMVLGLDRPGVSPSARRGLIRWGTPERRASVFRSAARPRGPSTTSASRWRALRHAPTFDGGRHSDPPRWARRCSTEADSSPVTSHFCAAVALRGANGVQARAHRSLQSVARSPALSSTRPLRSFCFESSRPTRHRRTSASA